MKLQVLNGCNCPKDAKLIALEGYIEQDRSAKTYSLNGEEVAVGNIVIDEAVFWSPSKAALHGDDHLGFFKMKVPRMKLGRVAMPKIKMGGRIRLPNVGKSLSKFTSNYTKSLKSIGKGLASGGKKLLKNISSGARDVFDAMSQPDESMAQEEPAQEMAPEPEQMPEEFQTPEAAQPIEDQDGNLLGFLPMLATAATSLLPALTSGGGIASMLPGLTSMLPQGAQNPVRQALPIAQRIRSQQLAKKRAQQAQRQNMLRQVVRTVAPQLPPPRPQQRPVQQWQPQRQQPQQVIIREQAQQPAQYIRPRGEEAPRDNTTLYAIGAATVVLVGGLVLMRTGNNTSRRGR